MSTANETSVEHGSSPMVETAPGQTYEDSRTGTEYVTVYVADDVVLLKDLGDADDDTWHSHRLERREMFERTVESGRFKLKGTDDAGHTVAGKLENLCDRYESQDGRKASHKAEAIDEAIGLIGEDTEPDDFDDVDFTEIDGIGATTAQKLRSSGFTVKKDIREASDEELLDVYGMGSSNLENLREEIDGRSR